MGNRVKIFVVAALMVPALGSAGRAAAATDHAFSGTVLGDTGRPLAGATVTVDSLDEGGDRATGTTDADGRWTVSVADGNYEITFADDADGYLTEKFDNHLESRFFSHRQIVRLSGRDVPSVDAQMTRLGTVSGRVLKDGEPAAGADVRLFARIAGDDLSTAVADSDGFFTVKDVVPGYYRADVGVYTETSQEYSDSVEITVRSGEHVAIPDIVFPEAKTRGTLDVRATPATEESTVSIRVWSASNPVAPVRDKTQGERGPAYLLDDLPPGDYKISTGLNTWIGGTNFFDAKTFPVRAGQTTRAEVADVPQTQLLGFVRNTRRQDLRGINLLVRRADDPQRIVATGVSSVGPGFQFDGLPQTDYLVTMVDLFGRYATTTVAYSSVITMQHTPTLSPLPHDDYTAEFRASEASGAHPPDYYLLHRVDDGGTAADISGQDGAFIQHAPPGQYKVRLGNASWLGGRSFSSARTITLTAGKTTDVTADSVPTNGDLAGRVISTDSVLMKDGVATVFAADNPNDIIASGPVDELFLIQDLPIRPYKVRITDPTGRYATRWVGGAGTFAAARSFTPEISEQTNLGTLTVPRQITPPAKVDPSVSFKLKSTTVKAGHQTKATVIVTARGVPRPTGTLLIKKGPKTLKTVTLRTADKGTRTFSVPKLSKGKHTLRVIYSGSATVTSKTSTTRTLRVR